jgi:uncharacterized NAD(P)/FAD-binding protein YdhS
MKSIAIIGAGFSGTMTAVHLLRNATGPITIYLIDGKETFSKGIAYTPYSKTHLLNVPAGKMSAFASEGDHFLNWLTKHKNYLNIKRDILSKSFIPRYIYGKYLENIWGEILKNNNPNTSVNIIHAMVQNLEIVSGKYFLSLSNGKMINADVCVVATGNHLPRNPLIKNNSFYNSDNYFQNPWDGKSVKEVDGKCPLLIVGNGLTMVDTVTALLENGFSNTIHSISPNGFNILPHRFLGTNYTALVDELTDDASLFDIVSLFNKHIKIVRQFGLSAEPIIDSIRPYTQSIWQRLTLQEKQIFMSRFRHLWGVARHRIPTHIHDKIQHLRIKNKFQIHAGNLLDFSENTNGVEVTFYNKRKQKNETLTVSRVINCTGPETDLQRISNPFLKSSLDKGIISQDELKLGINADPNSFNAISKDGEVHKNLYVIGTNLRGILWESTAVNELRLQAQRLAENLISTIQKEALLRTPSGI